MSLRGGVSSTPLKFSHIAKFLNCGAPPFLDPGHRAAAEAHPLRDYYDVMHAQHLPFPLGYVSGRSRQSWDHCSRKIDL